jgi:hypothetical protein
MQVYATGFVVLSAAAVVRIDREGDMSPDEIYVASVKPQGFADAGAGVEEGDHQRAKGIIASCDQTLGFLRCNPTDASWRLLGTLHNDL